MQLHTANNHKRQPKTVFRRKFQFRSRANFQLSKKRNAGWQHRAIVSPWLRNIDCICLINCLRTVEIMIGISVRSTFYLFSAADFPSRFIRQNSVMSQVQWIIRLWLDDWLAAFKLITRFRFVIDQWHHCKEFDEQRTLPRRWNL